MHTESFDLLSLHSLLDTTDITDASEDHALYSLGIGLNQLQSNLDKYRSFPCAVCNNSGHSFQNYPVLQDTPKVREAYGKLRAYLNRCCNVANKLNKSLSDLQATPVHVLQQYSLLSAPPASPSLAAISSLTTPSGLKSVHTASSAAPTVPLEDDASTDGSSCANSLDFR